MENISISEKIKEYNKNKYHIFADGQEIKFKVSGLILRETMEPTKRFVIATVTDEKSKNLFEAIDKSVAAKSGIDIVDTVDPKYSGMRLYLPHLKNHGSEPARFWFDIFDSERNRLDTPSVQEDTVIDILVRLRVIREYEHCTRLIYEVLQVLVSKEPVPTGSRHDWDAKDGPDSAVTASLKDYSLEDHDDDDREPDFEYDE